MFAYYPLPGASGGGGGGPLAIEIRPSPAEKYDPNPLGSVQIAVRTIVTGGTAPYTYAWTFQSGDAAIYPIAYDGAENAFYFDNDSGTPSVRSAVWRCTVTDAVAATAFADVTVTLAKGVEPP